MALQLRDRGDGVLAPERPLELRLHPQQGHALTTPATEVLYGGAAGGGKSHLIRVAAITWCMQVPGLQTYIFRRLFPELVANHMQGPTAFPVLLAPLVNAGQVRIVKAEIRFSNGSRIYLRHCQYEHDVFSYQGAEIHVLLIDELTHWTQSMYRYLRGRCRMTAIDIPPAMAGLFPRILAGTNPGGVGHHWVKKDFVNAGPGVIRRMRPQEGRMLRQYVPAKLTDNPSLLRADPDYVYKLEGLGDPLLVRAMKEGDWKIVAGAMFGGVWSDERHVCRPFAIPQGWPIWRGGDDGYASFSALYWLTQDPDAKTVYVISEIYRTGMLPDESAQRTLERDKAVMLVNGYGTRHFNAEPLAGIMDSAAFADTGTSSAGQKVPSRAAQMNALGCRWRPAEKGPGSRVHRVQDFHRRLAPNPVDRAKRPGIIFFDVCQNAIETIPTLPRDPKDPEDVDTNAEDHAFDAVTYGLQKTVSYAGPTRITGT